MQKNTDIAKKTMEILIATEWVADQIIANKQEIIALDKRRQDTREAIRNLSKSEGQDKTWITLGSMLVKMKREKAQGIMNKDQDHVEAEINRLRTEQKLLITKQRDLEFEKPLRGYDLKPLSGKDISAMKTNLPSF